MDRYQFIVRILEPAVLGIMLLATATCLLKHKRAFATLGTGATGVALWVVLNSWNSKGGLEDLGSVIVFGYVVLPLAAVMVVGAVRLGRPGSWWWQRVSSEKGRERANIRYARADTTRESTGRHRGDLDQHLPATPPNVPEAEPIND